MPTHSFYKISGSAADHKGAARVWKNYLYDALALGEYGCSNCKNEFMVVSDRRISRAAQTVRLIYK
jgi:hypothetical protein